LRDVVRTRLVIRVNGEVVGSAICDIGRERVYVRLKVEVRDSEDFRRSLESFFKNVAKGRREIWVRAEKGSSLEKLLKELGFTEAGKSVIMGLELKGDYKYSGELAFKRVECDEWEDFKRLHDEIFVNNPFSSPLSKILRPLDPIDAKAFICGPHSEAYFTYLREELVGIVGLSHYGEAGKIPIIGLLPECRGRGLGKQLLNFALMRLKELGVKRIELAADVQNVPAMRLYTSAGFKIVKEHVYYVLHM